MKIKSFFLIAILFIAWSCKAQGIPQYALAGELERDADGDSVISWYNKVVVSPKFDTVTVFKMPEFSDLRYVIMRPLKGIARVETISGRFVCFLDPNRFWVEQVNFNKEGEVVRGMNAIMVSSNEPMGLLVQYERCETCKFKSNKKGEL